MTIRDDVFLKGRQDGLDYLGFTLTYRKTQANFFLEQDQSAQTPPRYRIAV